MTNNDLNLANITTPIAATTRTIFAPTVSDLPAANTLLPIRGIAQDTGKMYTIQASWVETDYTE